MSKDISKEDRAYFAGLLDGEGCIQIHKSKGNNCNHYTLTVGFHITYKEVIIEMKDLFRGNISKVNMKKLCDSDSAKNGKKSGYCSPENWKQCYLYEMHGRDALYFLKVVEPFCREKKEQAAIGIRYEEGRRSKNCSNSRSESETKRCEFFHRELRRMKHEKSEDIDVENGFEDDQQSLFSFVEEI